MLKRATNRLRLSLVVIGMAGCLGGCETQGVVKMADFYAVPQNPPSSQKGDHFSLDCVSKSQTAELPPGLSWDEKTGRIFGTPQAAFAATLYTVSAATPPQKSISSLCARESQSAAQAMVSREFLLAVNPAQPSAAGVGAPNSAQAIPTITLVRGELVAFMPVVVAAGSNVSFKIDPELPKGLLLDVTTGQISGVPSGTSPRTSYTVTVASAAGPADPPVGPTPQGPSGSQHAGQPAAGQSADQAQSSPQNPAPTEQSTSQQQSVPETFTLQVVDLPTAGGASLSTAPAYVVLTVGVPVSLPPTVLLSAPPSGTAYAISGGPLSSVFDRMYDQALVTCLSEKNSEDERVFLTQGGLTASSLLVGSIVPILNFTKTTPTTAGVIASVVTLLQPALTSVAGNLINSLGGSTSAQGANASSADFGSTINLLDAVHQRFLQSPAALADLSANRDFVITQYRMGLEQACLNTHGTAAPPPTAAASASDAAPGASTPATVPGGKKAGA